MIPVLLTCQMSPDVVISQQRHSVRSDNVLAPGPELVWLHQSPGLCLRQQIGPDPFGIVDCICDVVHGGGVVVPVEVVKGVPEHVRPDRGVHGSLVYSPEHLQHADPGLGKDVLVHVQNGGKLVPSDQPQVALVESREHPLSPDLLLGSQGQVPLEEGDLARGDVVPQQLVHVRPQGVVVEDKVAEPEELVELYELNQPLGPVPIVMERLHANGHLACDVGGRFLVGKLGDVQLRSRKALDNVTRLEQ